RLAFAKPRMLRPANRFRSAGATGSNCVANAGKTLADDNSTREATITIFFMTEPLFRRAWLPSTEEKTAQLANGAPLAWLLFLLSHQDKLDGIAGFVGRTHVHPRERDQPAVDRVVVAPDQWDAGSTDKRETIALDVSVLEVSQMKLGASHLVSGDVIDSE